MKELRKIFMNGIIDENPTFRMVLGMCPTLAITTAVSNGIGMGLAVTFVLVFSNLVISLLRKAIPDQIRIPAFIVVIATFVTIVQLVVKAFVPALDAALGVFIPLIVVNCIIFGRAEAFAFKNKPIPAIVDGLGMGIGFTIAITLISAVRELFGAGTLLGVQVMPAGYLPMDLLVKPAGGFIVLGLLLALMNKLLPKKA
ncbi:MAG: electron transport complex subunit E [Clostridiales bacterium]|nr:electron transport complex subunit E [Clostridiales bacterium]MDY3763621.1 electron transport complex subunit E [Candidatus Ventricola sp.]MCI6587813.1 electron transport complex subunit E [Clostridiales bacterium]MDY3832225.1 electron transport complex subunit E [Candidatus Ventricola sp.]MDY4541805.1 electron transport complex subunit E [Candidatus Ventricola sp.]